MNLDEDIKKSVYVYHGTYIDNLGPILRDGHLKPTITKLMPNKSELVHLAFRFTKAAKYGDVVFEIPLSSLKGNVIYNNVNEEVTTDAPVEVNIRNIMMFDDERCYKEIL